MSTTISRVNPYTYLLDILPKRPLDVGTVIDSGDGFATVQGVGAGLYSVRGVAAIGDRVFFRDGVIEGPAPVLPLVIISV